jgi:Inner centromere protein, ARK binding region
MKSRKDVPPPSTRRAGATGAVPIVRQRRAVRAAREARAKAEAEAEILAEETVTGPMLPPFPPAVSPSCEILPAPPQLSNPQSGEPEVEVPVVDDMPPTPSLSPSPPSPPLPSNNKPTAELKFETDAAGDAEGRAELVFDANAISEAKVDEEMPSRVPEALSPRRRAPKPRKRSPQSRACIPYPPPPVPVEANVADCVNANVNIAADRPARRGRTVRAATAIAKQAAAPVRKSNTAQKTKRITRAARAAEVTAAAVINADEKGKNVVFAVETEVEPVVGKWEDHRVEIDHDIANSEVEENETMQPLSRKSKTTRACPTNSRPVRSVASLRRGPSVVFGSNDYNETSIAVDVNNEQPYSNYNPADASARLDPAPHMASTRTARATRGTRGRGKTVTSPVVVTVVPVASISSPIARAETLTLSASLALQDSFLKPPVRRVAVGAEHFAKSEVVETEGDEEEVIIRRRNRRTNNCRVRGKDAISAAENADAEDPPIPSHRRLLRIRHTRSGSCPLTCDNNGKQAEDELPGREHAVADEHNDVMPAPAEQAKEAAFKEAHVRDMAKVQSAAETDSQPEAKVVSRLMHTTVYTLTTDDSTAVEAPPRPRRKRAEKSLAVAATKSLGKRTGRILRGKAATAIEAATSVEANPVCDIVAPTAYARPTAGNALLSHLTPIMVNNNDDGDRVSLGPLLDSTSEVACGQPNLKGKENNGISNSDPVDDCLLSKAKQPSSCNDILPSRTLSVGLLLASDGMPYFRDGAAGGKKAVDNKGSENADAENARLTGLEFQEVRTESSTTSSSTDSRKRRSCEPRTDDEICGGSECLLAEERPSLASIADEENDNRISDAARRAILSPLRKKVRDYSTQDGNSIPSPAYANATVATAANAGASVADNLCSSRAADTSMMPPPVRPTRIGKEASVMPPPPPPPSMMCTIPAVPVASTPMSTARTIAAASKRCLFTVDDRGRVSTVGIGAVGRGEACATPVPASNAPNHAVPPSAIRSGRLFAANGDIYSSTRKPAHARIGRPVQSSSLKPSSSAIAVKKNRMRAPLATLSMLEKGLPANDIADLAAIKNSTSSIVSVDEEGSSVPIVDPTDDVPTGGVARAASAYPVAIVSIVRTQIPKVPIFSEPPASAAKSPTVSVPISTHGPAFVSNDMALQPSLPPLPLVKGSSPLHGRVPASASNSKRNGLEVFTVKESSPKRSADDLHKTEPAKSQKRARITFIEPNSNGSLAQPNSSHNEAKTAPLKNTRRPRIVLAKSALRSRIEGLQNVTEEATAFSPDEDDGPSGMDNSAPTTAGLSCGSGEVGLSRLRARVQAVDDELRESSGTVPESSDTLLPSAPRRPPSSLEQRSTAAPTLTSQTTVQPGSQLGNLMTSITSFLPSFRARKETVVEETEDERAEEASRVAKADAERRDAELATRREAARLAKQKETDEKQKRAEAKRRLMAQAEIHREEERQRKEADRARKLQEAEEARKKAKDEEDRRREEKRRRVEEHQRRLASQEEQRRRAIQEKEKTQRERLKIAKGVGGTSGLPAGAVAIASGAGVPGGVTGPPPPPNASSKFGYNGKAPRGMQLQTPASAAPKASGPPAESYDMSAHKDSRPDSSDSEDEERSRHPMKKIPGWARSVNMSQALVDETRDPDSIFEKVHTLDLDEVFDGKRKFRSRSSSGVWVRDRLTAQEELEYKKMTTGFMPPPPPPPSRGGGGSGSAL